MQYWLLLIIGCVACAWLVATIVTTRSRRLAMRNADLLKIEEIFSEVAASPGLRIQKLVAGDTQPITWAVRFNHPRLVQLFNILSRDWFEIKATIYPISRKLDPIPVGKFYAESMPCHTGAGSDRSMMLFAEMGEPKALPVFVYQTEGAIGYSQLAFYVPQKLAYTEQPFHDFQLMIKIKGLGENPIRIFCRDTTFEEVAA